MIFYEQNPPPKIPPWAIGVGAVVIGGIVYFVWRNASPAPAVTGTTSDGDGGVIPPQVPTPMPPPGPKPVPPAPFPPPPGPVEPEPLPKPQLPTVVKFDTKTAGQLDIDKYPWGGDGTIYVHPSSPTPSMFFQVQQGNNMSWLVRNAVGATLVLAGRDGLLSGMNPNSAEYNENWAKRLRSQMRDGLVCGWYNDTAYGQTNVETAGGEFGMGPNGRGLNWKPRHAPNMALMQGGQLTRRTTNLQGVRDVPSGEAQSQMFLWVPAPNLSKLQGPKEDINIVFDQQWQDGITTLNPPPPIRDVADAIFEGGCPGWEQ